MPCNKRGDATVWQTLLRGVLKVRSGNRFGIRSGFRFLLVRSILFLHYQSFVHIRSYTMMRKPLLSVAIFLVVAVQIVSAQNLPDRTVVLDPLADTTVGTNGFILLPATRMYGEFARYSNTSGSDHRWNAKMGGYVEFARQDSTWSVGMVGTMEVIVDPQNDIAFNPRAIFWEEGLMGSLRLGTHSALQLGYIHRCKHDIDNLEIYAIRNEWEQRTLIYSGLMTRWLLRPRPLLRGSWNLRGGLALRNDWFLHLHDAQDSALNLNRLLDAFTVTGRLELHKQNAPWMLHLTGNGMLSFYGEDEGFPERFSGVTSYLDVPFLEFGVDIFNPRGMSFTAFVRGEWQRDGGLTYVPTETNLLLFGIRAASFGSMW